MFFCLGNDRKVPTDSDERGECTTLYMFPDASLFDCQSDRQTLSLLEDIYNSYSKTRATLALGVLGSIPTRIL